MVSVKGYCVLNQLHETKRKHFSVNFIIITTLFIRLSKHVCSHFSFQVSVEFTYPEMTILCWNWQLSQWSLVF